MDYKKEIMKEKEPYYRSPSGIILIIVLSILLVEGFVMLTLYMLPPGHELLKSVLDPITLVLILSPVFYFFMFRPLILLINERRIAEDELRKERDRAQSYLNIAGVMLLVLDREGRIRLINKKGCEILGYSEDELTGKDWFKNFIPERLRNEILLGFEALISNSAEAYGSLYENPVLTKSGEEKIILWTHTVIRENGKIIGTLSSGEDISRRKLAERSLTESETKYRFIHDMAFDGIIISDQSDRVLESNPSAEEIFGYEKSELKDVEIIKLMPDRYRSLHREGIKRFLETGKSDIRGRVLEYEGLKKSGEVFPIEIIINSFKIGEKITITGTIRDVTERKRAEREKETIQARLNQSLKMEAIGRLAGGIAHDFNNILTAIRGNAELTMEWLEKSDPAYKNLDEIILSVLHASKLTTQLLLFSRGQPFEFVPLNINKIAEGLLIMINRLIGEGITVSTELDPGIWMVKADEGNIEQVIMNLAVNARDAMPHGGTLTIKTENVILAEEQCKSIPEARPGATVCLSVADTGMGMDQDVVQHIFEPFFTTKEQGTGLGLAAVYGIVKQHGGWITVKSAQGVGTTFRIYLPALPVREEVKELPKMPKKPGHGERILFVEDDPILLEFARAALSENGYVVFTAENAKGAAEVFKKERGAFSLILSDLALPDRNGLQLANDLRAGNPDASVLITSSFTEIRSPRAEMTQKGFRYLRKPYSISSLLMAVAISLEKGQIK